MGTSPLADAFATCGTIKGPSCGVNVILGRLDKADRQLVEGWLAAGPSSIGHAHIARALTKVGHRVSPSAISRHRRGECLCSDVTTVG